MALAGGVLAAAGILAALGTSLGQAQAPSESEHPSDVASRLKGRFVFLLDASGSMRIRDQIPVKPGPLVSRLEAALNEVTETVDALAEKGRYEFDVLYFRGETKSLAEDVFHVQGLLPLDDETRLAARAFLKNLRATGTTRLLSALRAAFDRFEERSEQTVPNTIFLYTDGVPTLEREEGRDPGRFSDFLRGFRLRVREANRNAVKMNTFAVGATSISQAFLVALASDHDGIALFGETAPFDAESPER
jgi:hypothetical protein